MITKKTIPTFFAVALIILSLNLISSQTIVAGKIYTSDYSNIVPGATVTITCNSNSLTTLSLSDGTYAVNFESGICNENDVAVIDADKATLKGTNTEKVIKCDETFECEGEFFALLNARLDTLIHPPSNTGGGGTTGFFMCGNGKCDTGERASTCPEDCEVTLVAPEDETNEETPENPIENETEDPEINKNYFWNLTLRNLIGLLIAIIILILGLSMTLAMQKKRSHNL